jgi:hypothetical protein
MEPTARSRLAGRLSPTEEPDKVEMEIDLDPGREELASSLFGDIANEDSYPVDLSGSDQTQNRFRGVADPIIISTDNKTLAEGVRKLHRASSIAVNSYFWKTRPPFTSTPSRFNRTSFFFGPPKAYSPTRPSDRMTR